VNQVIPTSSRHLAQKSYILVDKFTFAPIIKKLNQLNGEVGPSVMLSNAELGAVEALTGVLEKTSFYHSSKIDRVGLGVLEKIVRTWPEDKIFPGTPYIVFSSVSCHIISHSLY